jgi:hypothetical protein
MAAKPDFATTPVAPDGGIALSGKKLSGALASHHAAH